METFVGICDNHDSGVCIFNGDELVFAINEERLNREKLTREFPIKSIKLILKDFNLLDTYYCTHWHICLFVKLPIMLDITNHH